MTDPQQLQQHKENQRILNELLALSKQQLEWNEAIEKKINPMYQVFNNLKSTNSVLVFAFKGLVLLGAAIGAGVEIFKVIFKK